MGNGKIPVVPHHMQNVLELNCASWSYMCYPCDSSHAKLWGNNKH